MLPEEEVLVVYVPTPADFALLRDAGWYRLPVHRAPRGLLAPIYAFYQGGAFGREAHQIRYVARRHGHELVTRQMLFPDQPRHPRALHAYYKLQFGPLLPLRRPIPSPRWRRLLFAHTTWGRLQRAQVIGDMFGSRSRGVDRQLRERPRLTYRRSAPSRRECGAGLTLPGGWSRHRAQSRPAQR